MPTLCSWPSSQLTLRPEAFRLSSISCPSRIRSYHALTGTGVSCNAYMTPAMIGQYCLLDQAGERLMKGAFDRLGLTGRSHDRILRMARTIADLDGSERIEAAHLAEAIQYRSSNLLK